MTLTRKKIRWIIRQKERQESTGIIAKIQGVTRRRGDQPGKHHREAGIIPVIGEAQVRPKKPITAEESGVVEDASERFSVGSEDIRDANLGIQKSPAPILQLHPWNRTISYSKPDGQYGFLDPFGKGPARFIRVTAIIKELSCWR
jgi:hypothetical protein